MRALQEQEYELARAREAMREAMAHMYGEIGRLKLREKYLTEGKPQSIAQAQDGLDLDYL